MLKKISILLIAFIIQFTSASHLVTGNTQSVFSANERKVISSGRNGTQKKKKEYKQGWIISGSVPVRYKPRKKAKAITIFYFGKQVKIKKKNEKWTRITDGKITGYINNKYVSRKEPPYTYKYVPANKSMKAYMDYRCITNTSSNQYKLQKKAYTGKDGIRKVNGRYCIALGSYYSDKVGQYVDITLRNNTVIHCVIADCKADAHTDNRNMLSGNGSLMEFVVDTYRLNHTARIMGDISFSHSEWSGSVKKIKVYR